MEKTKAKFYRASNGILGKLQNLKNTPVTLHLVHSIALPTLMYGIESMSLIKTQLTSLEHPWTRIFMKIFVTFDFNVVRQCQFFSGLLPICHYYAMRRMGFLIDISQTNNTLLCLMYELSGFSDIAHLAANYNSCTIEQFIKKYASIVPHQFRLETMT